MKKLLSLILLFSTFAGAQVYQTFSMHLVRIEGDLEAFEKVQTMYMQKVAQAAVEKGDIAFWAFLKRFTLDGLDDEKRKNYLFVQSNTDITAMLSDKNSWWSNAKNVLSKEEMDMVSALRKSYTWVEDSRHIFVDEVSIAKDSEVTYNLILQDLKMLTVLSRKTNHCGKISFLQIWTK